MIRIYVIPKLGGQKLQTLTGADLNRMYSDLLSNGRTETRRGLGPGLSVKTVRNVHGLMSKAMRDAVRWGHILRNPCDASDPPKGKSPEMQAWTGEQLRKFVEYTSTMRWAAIWRLQATTGLRRGEILGLRWWDIDSTGRR